MADVSEAPIPSSRETSESVPPRASFVRSALRSPWTNLVLFLLTVASTFYVGADIVGAGGPLRGWVFAVPLLAILVTHEFGHYLQARRHRVDASLPYFLPLPIPPLGTLGAVIAMRGRIRTRDALLDIGASGPIAGLVIAIPVLAIGLRLSTVQPITPHGLDEGQSLFYLLMKRVVLGPIPAGHDVFLHPTAFAGWAGLFMTMLNLMPVGQLDGGHVAYALFGPKQNRYSRWFHSALPLIGVSVGAWFAIQALRQHAPWSEVASSSIKGANWLFWWLLLWFLGRGGHPPTETGTLSRGRTVVAWLTLLMFVVLFMPLPMNQR